ncbi:hypothetical protein RN001_007080 [Aquatica leii]|uniref:Uncharacterized protein n=1 Tax=Aquatica leii TaxID=1421715 RepID=A0AAN7P881_9COLE|nr:hypothetical protein RN001_007080 [Aquatica leii]
MKLLMVTLFIILPYSDENESDCINSSGSQSISKISDDTSGNGPGLLYFASFILCDEDNGPPFEIDGKYSAVTSNDNVTETEQKTTTFCKMICKLKCWFDVKKDLFGCKIHSNCCDGVKTATTTY